MSDINPLLVPVILLIGVTAACGQGAAVAEQKTADARVSEVREAGAPDTSTNAGAAPAATLEAKDVPAPSQSPSPLPSPSAVPATAVKTLPLKRGFYVASDTSCGRASNATTLLVGRDGINGSRDSCTFKKIEKTGATTYRVASACSDGGAAWGREDTVETYTNTYEIPNETSFRVTYEDGSSKSSRYCAQSTMSSDFRDNDISDVIG